MTVDIFRECRERVSARRAAEWYGAGPVSTSGFCRCPFHAGGRERTPSLRFFSDGHWRCFACNRGGSSIDLTAQLFDLAPLDAVRKLDADFELHLPLDRPQTQAERQAAQRRREIQSTFAAFERWRLATIQALNECFRLGHSASRSLQTPEDIDSLTDAQALAICEQPRLEWLSDLLSNGSMEEIMPIFRRRKEVARLCERILSSTRVRFNAA